MHVETDQACATGQITKRWSARLWYQRTHIVADYYQLQGSFGSLKWALANKPGKNLKEFNLDALWCFGYAFTWSFETIECFCNCGEIDCWSEAVQQLKELLSVLPLSKTKGWILAQTFFKRTNLNEIDPEAYGNSARGAKRRGTAGTCQVQQACLWKSIQLMLILI